mgnify:FL=1
MQRSEIFLIVYILQVLKEILKLVHHKIGKYHNKNTNNLWNNLDIFKDNLIFWLKFTQIFRIREISIITTWILKDLSIILNNFPWIIKDLPWILKDLSWILKDLPWIIKDLSWIIKDFPWILLNNFPWILKDLPWIFQNISIILHNN